MWRMRFFHIEPYAMLKKKVLLKYLNNQTWINNTNNCIIVQETFYVNYHHQLNFIPIQNRSQTERKNREKLKSANKRRSFASWRSRAIFPHVAALVRPSYIAGNFSRCTNALTHIHVCSYVYFPRGAMPCSTSERVNILFTLRAALHRRKRRNFLERGGLSRTWLPSIKKMRTDTRRALLAKKSERSYKKASWRNFNLKIYGRDGIQWRQCAWSWRDFLIDRWSGFIRCRFCTNSKV